MRIDPRRVLLLALLLIATQHAPGCAIIPPLPLPDLTDIQDPPEVLPGAGTIHRIESPELRESSGLVRSRSYPGVLWSHNDSGDRPRIFAITPGGDLIAEFSVENARNQDWEDITSDDAGHLYVGDIGNNLNQRRDLTVYRIPEPDPFAQERTVRANRVLRFRYADQEKYPTWGRWNYDAEALFWMDGALYILTKHRSDCATTLYRLPVTSSGEEAVLDPLTRFDLGAGRRTRLACALDPLGTVTAADLSPDGRTLAVLTYRALFVYDRSPDDDLEPFRLMRRIDLHSRRTRMAESVTWDDGQLVFGNEQGHLFRIPDPMTTRFERYPP